MPDMAYNSEGVRSGGEVARSAGDSSYNARSLLQGSTIGGSAFGEVNNAESLAAGLSTTRDGFAGLGNDVHARHLTLQINAAGTAAQGDQLVPETTALAQRGGGSIAAGMSGD